MRSAATRLDMLRHTTLRVCDSRHRDVVRQSPPRHAAARHDVTEASFMTRYADRTKTENVCVIAKIL
jgi:hypothetical protein